MLQTLKKYHKLNPLVKFGINGLLLAAIWFVFYQFFRYTHHIDVIYNFISESLTHFLLQVSKLMFTIFGFDAEVAGKVIKISGTSGVYLDKGCLGRNLLGLFTGFILAYPGRFFHKIWYIPLGILIINFINVVRICGLTYLVAYHPDAVEFNHHYAFKYTAYFFIFLMWYFWIKKFGPKRKPTIQKVTETRIEEQNMFVS